jgi:multidrug efflux pump subunit AcrB
MTGIVRIALERPYTLVVAAMLVLLFGVMSAIRTPKDIFPNIGIPVIAVVWSYAGLPPDDMSSRIVYIFERGLTTTVNDIEHIESQSVPGYGIVKIYFQPRVNIAAAEAQVTAISQTQLKQLPPGVTPPLLVIFNASSVPILQLALSSPTASQTELNDIATNFVRPPLTNVAGAGLPLPYGGMPRQVQIDLDQRALHSYGLGAQDVVNALSVQNLINPAGTEKIGAYEYTINLNGSPQKVADFNDLPIKAVNGAMVYVRDVAFAHDGSPPQINVVQLDGRKGVLMTVLKVGSASALDIIAGIKELLSRIQETLPPGVELKIVNDQSGFVKASVFSVIREGVIAAGLTGLMILLFLGSWRSTLIISISIPLSILAALPVLAALGETINVMTLGGFALAVGMLVDEATVTIENINWHLEQGKEIKTAILDGAAQIVVAATLSLLCICIAFVPMFGLGGVAGYLFRPLAEAVVFAMIASYLWSRTLVPTMALYLLRNQVHLGPGGHEHGGVRTGNPLRRFQQGFERAFEKFRTAHVGLLGLALQHRRVGVTIFLVMPLLSFGLMPFLRKNFFPEIESDALRLHVRAHPGTRIEEVTRLINEVEAEIRTVIPPDEILSAVDNIGLPLAGTNLAYSNSGTIGIIDADILISLGGETSMPTAEYVDDPKT